MDTPLEDSEYFFGDEEEDDYPTVCIEHKRFVPCRACGREMAQRMSSKPEDVEMVRRYQERENDV